MPADFDDEVAHPHAAFTGDIGLVPLRRRQIAPHRLKLSERADFFPGLFQSLPDHHEISGRYAGLRGAVGESQRGASQSDPVFVAPGGFKIVGEISRLAVVKSTIRRIGYFSRSVSTSIG